jgi:hypothetical protein
MCPSEPDTGAGASATEPTVTQAGVAADGNPPADAPGAVDAVVQTIKAEVDAEVAKDLTSYPATPTVQMPSIGRIVHYRLRADQVALINSRRDCAQADAHQFPGYQAHEGSPVIEGDTFPMVVVRVWGATCVNGQVVLDGGDHLWVTGALLGDAPGTWYWPPRA